jgi:hypothetical protein
MCTFNLHISYPQRLSNGTRNMTLQSFAEQFVTSTRRYLFVRPEDGVLILYPNS